MEGFIATVLIIIVEVWILAIAYCVYQLARNEAIYNIRKNWIDTNDKRHDKYSYVDMHNPCINNWIGIKYPKDKHYCV